jgi:uncharacterized membrane protein YkoI
MSMLASAALTLAVAASAVATQPAILVKDLPPAVQKAVRDQESKGATIKKISAEKEHGKTVYEVETLVDGHTRDLIVDATGRIVESEEAISIDAVPAPVKAALHTAGKVVKLEKLTKGASVTYEAQIEKNGKKSEIVLDAAGKRVKS